MNQTSTRAARARWPGLVAEVRPGWRLWRRHRRGLRRATLYHGIVQQLLLGRDDRCRRRAERLAGRVRRLLAPMPPEDCPGGDADPIAAAERRLREVRAPLRRAGRALLLRAGTAAVAAAAALALLAVALPGLRGALIPPDLARGRPWRASSALAPHAASGKLPAGDEPLFFHTENSQEGPWLEVELPPGTLLRRIVVENRRDCCRERALPLNVEAQVETASGKDWRLLAQRRSPFRTWEHRLPPTRTSRLRVRIPGPGPLHLARVSLYDR